MSCADSFSPDLAFEKAARESGHASIAGIDEAGRGPWAGPVVAASVVLTEGAIPAGLNDSKKLREDKRERLFDELIGCSQVGIGIAEVERIDRDNILAATMWAMAESVKALPHTPDYALIDGNRLPDLHCDAEAVVKGDGRSLSIAAASIIAKVTRDRILRDLDGQYPGYGFARHKGYGTRQHQQALAKLGLCPAHRKSFAPIRLLLENRAA
ncbi:MAG: ribonuclease HII [Pseudomonadota bacterium]